jgi:sterol desaturase/sphingolipid hydroxylase (fatty acid hydroxylase superfamily)
MRVHIFTFILWEIFKFANSAEGHSGYAVPWIPSRLLPFHYDSSYHDFHHSKNVGNYSTTFYLFELILGYNKAFFEYKLGK